MKDKTLNTNNDLTGLVTRITLGLILLPHGAQKMPGCLGGYGFTGTMGFLVSFSLHTLTTDFL